MTKEAQATQTAAAEAIKLEVRAYPIAEPKNKTVAFASVTINDMVAINGIQVIDGKNGLFAQMPQAKDARGDFRDIAFPVTKELRQQLNEAILDEYVVQMEKVLNEKASVTEQLREGLAAAKEARAKTPPAKEADAQGLAAKGAEVKDTPSATRGKAAKAAGTEL